MADRTTRTKEIFLGDELVTGKRTNSQNRLIEPTAEVKIINKSIEISFEKDVDKIKFTANIKYQEATQKEDIAYFLLEVFDNKNNLLSSAQTNSKETFARENKLEGQLSLETDLAKWSGKTVQLRAYLKCWLEESSWKPRGGGTETISAEDFVNITLEVPEIKKPKQSPIISFTVVGRALRKGEKEKDYAQQDNGKDYSVITLIHNTTGNKITYGELDFYENNNMLSNLSRGIKEIEIGSVYPTTLKFVKSWKWYKIEKDGRLTIIDNSSKMFFYKLDFYLKDEYGYEWRNNLDKPTNKLRINISTPKYKVDSVEVYNSSFDAEYWADIASLILELEVIFGSAGIGYLVGKAFGPIAGAIAGGSTGALGLRIGDNISKLLTGKTVKEWAQELRVNLKKIIDDPPKFDKNYKQITRVKQLKLLRARPKDKYGKMWHDIIKSHLFAISNMRAVLTASDRAWSAKLKNDEPLAKKQRAAFGKFKNSLVKELYNLSQNTIKLSKIWAKLKVDSAKLTDLKQAIKRGDLNVIKQQIKKKGISNKKLKELEQLISTQSINKLDAVKAYSNYSKSLKKLATSIERWTI